MLGPSIYTYDRILASVCVLLPVGEVEQPDLIRCTKDGQRFDSERESSFPSTLQETALLPPTEGR
jgi:hypothetical protein